MFRIVKGRYLKKGESTMRKQPTLKRRFINDVYNGDYKQYLKERREDYCKVQFAWSCYIDGLCKNGQITQAQYDRVVF